MLHTFVILFVFYLTTVCKIAWSTPTHFPRVVVWSVNTYILSFMLWWIDLHFTVLLIDYTMYNFIGYAVDSSPQCCHIYCRIIVTTSVSSLHQTALPTRPSLSPRVYKCTSDRFIRQRYTVAAKQRAQLRRMAQTTTSIRWTHIAVCRGKW